MAVLTSLFVCRLFFLVFDDGGRGRCGAGGGGGGGGGGGRSSWRW